MASRPLVVATVAMVLLLASVAFEVTFQRSYALDVHDAKGWQTLGRVGGNGGAAGNMGRVPLGPSRAILVDPNGTVQFRLSVDNGYPWSYSHHFTVTFQGTSVAEGDVTAGARDLGEATFTIPASTLLVNLPTAKGGPGGNVTYASLDVQIGQTDLSGTVQLQEAGA